jgi:hypothetical protein
MSEQPPPETKVSRRTTLAHNAIKAVLDFYSEALGDALNENVQLGAVARQLSLQANTAREQANTARTEKVKLHEALVMVEAELQAAGSTLENGIWVSHARTPGLSESLDKIHELLQTVES